MIPGFEKAVIGMKHGEAKRAKVPADEAYGQYHKGLVVEVARDEFPTDFQPVLGRELESRQSDGRICAVTVTEVSSPSVMLNGNHPLAGKDLAFEIRLVEIA